MKDLTKIISTIPQKITTDKDYLLASDALSVLNKKVKAVEAERKEKTAPILKQKQEIDAKYKVFTKPVMEVIKNVKGLMADYHALKEQEQLAYEQKMLANSDQGEIIVDDKVAEIKRGEISSNSVTKITKYKFKDESLNEVCNIKQNLFKDWLQHNKLPDYIVEYEEAQVRIR